jgi:hypothetical protein
MRDRAAVLSLLAGVLVIAASQLAAPLGSPPLYDGVVVQEPYRYLTPGPSQAGSPTSATSSPPVEGTTSPLFALATGESPPQAQMISPPGAFELTPAVRSLTVSIAPIAAPAPPSSGTIASNVYRFSVADESGTLLAVGDARRPTLFLRADGVSTGTIARFADGSWQELPTLEGGEPGTFTTNAMELGDFAVIADLVTAPPANPIALDPTLVIAAAVTALLSVVALVALMSRRERRRSVAVPSTVVPRLERQRTVIGPLAKRGPLRSRRRGRRRSGSQ